MRRSRPPKRHGDNNTSYNGKNGYLCKTEAEWKNISRHFTQCQTKHSLSLQSNLPVVQSESYTLSKTAKHTGKLFTEKTGVHPIKEKDSEFVATTVQTKRTSSEKKEKGQWYSQRRNKIYVKNKVFLFAKDIQIYWQQRTG